MPTFIGLLFALSTIFIPFGAAILSNIDLSIWTIGFETFYWKFFLGIMTALSPIIIAIIHAFYLLFHREKKIWKLERLFGGI